MIKPRRRFVFAVLTAVLIGGLCAGTQAPPVLADAVTVSDGMPTQEWIDLPSTDPAKSSSGQAGWGDLAGGTASRPYVSALSIINGDVSTPVVVDGTASTATPASGGVATIVSPFNLCRIGQTPRAGTCYTSPNRVGLTVGYNAGGSNGYNFDAPSVAVTPTIGADTVIDLTVALNTLGRNLRWTWVNGDLLYWRTTNLGHDDATVRIKFKAATSPYIQSFPDGNGCTATPIFNCSIAQADTEMRTASVVFSLDDTLDPALTGAVFATQNAIAGFLRPGGTASAPTLDVQVASSHRSSDGALQHGVLEAFIPAAALINLYGVLPADAASTFTTTRAGDSGTNAAPTYAAWTAADNGADGLFVTVRDITFSVPKYRVKGKLAATATHAQANGRKTLVSATVRRCSAQHRCLATVYDLGRAAAKRYTVTKTPVLVNASVVSSALQLRASSATMKRGERYLLVVRAARGGALIASTLGTVG